MIQPRAWLQLLLCLATGAMVSAWLGQDANYDLQAYHLFNGGSFLNGRFSRDLAGAGMQGYFNPVLDAVYAGLAMGPLRDLPRVLAAVMGLWYGASLFLTVRIARHLYPGQAGLATPAVVLAVTGASMVSQIGTTFNEVQVATFMLGGMLASLHPGSRPAALAGALFGAAAGLKLTAGVFAPAAMLAGLCLQPGCRPGLRAAFAFAATWLIGFAITDGWWAIMLARRFGNPVFPLFNGLFRSPWYPPAGFIDDRFLPGSFVRALIYPILWLTGPPTLVSEIPLRDPRGAAALCLGLAAAVAALVRKRPPLPPAQRAVLLFLVVGYVAWVSTTGILRYAVVLEVACGLVIPLLLARLLPRRTAPALAAALCVGVLATTQYGAWGRIPYGPQALRADVDWVQPDTLIIPTVWSTLSHMVPLMPHQDSIRVLGLDFVIMDGRGWRLHDEAVRMVSQHAGPIAVLTYTHPGSPAYELGEIGLDPVMTDCRPVGSTFVTVSANGPFACTAHRRAAAPLPSPFWKQAAARYRTLMQPPDDGMSLFGETYLKSAGPAARGTHIIDWAGILWRGPRPLPDVTKAAIDPGTLYILTPPLAAIMAGRIDPGRDAIGLVDGVTVLAPGWRDCARCTTLPKPLGP